ncbi:MAG: T9SS type A sorting domain-containing protein [Chitinophagaceae bacterium]|nr:T9SS type A sorting domain-containing protein [Chitinophagaceae bacterium]
MHSKFTKAFFFAILMLMSGFSSTLKAQTYPDVAPIFIANCTSCHHAGGLQFPLTSYSAILPWGNLIKNAVQNGNMPPWPADPTYKHFVRERVMSAADKATLINWINAGMPAGDTTLAPPVPTYNNYQLNGTPDLVLNLPKFTSNANATDMYICVNVPSGLTQDRYIRAFEFIPGNAALIHHAVMTIDTTGTAVDDYSGNCTNFQGQINIGDFAPGMGPTVLPGVAPTKFGFRMKAGSTMSFQIHIPEGTAGLKDSSQLRIFFYPVGEPNVRPMFFETVLQNWNFYVPANDSILAHATFPVGGSPMPIAVSLYSAFPHSHKTCTSIINYLYSGIDTIPLIRIPHWDFHWQYQYIFNNMVKFPVGYHMYSTHKFDNTVNNPETPDPNVPVLPGLFTTDEMLFDSYIYTLYQAGDENADIASILANDPLLTPTSVSNVADVFAGVKVYPNPFTTETNIDYTLMNAQYVQVGIYDLTGREVSRLSSGIEGMGKHRLVWNGSDASGNKLSPGIYMYQIKAGKAVLSGKVVLND